MTIAAHGGPARGDVAALDVGAWLRLAATPTFLVMTLLTIALGGEPRDICSSSPSAWSLNAMSAMYALMALFHSLPWIALIRRRCIAECA